VFFIIEGAVTFKVHDSSYILCTGGSILVPRGNTYYIENISDRDAKLFFAQARRVLADDEEPVNIKPASTKPSETPTPAPERRSSSAGVVKANRTVADKAGKSKRGTSKAKKG
jgi:centromere protein C